MRLLRQIALYLLGQAGLTVAAHYLFRRFPVALAENAMMGWLDDKIGDFLGWTAPSISAVIKFTLNWGVPFVAAALVLFVYHKLHTRWFSASTNGKNFSQVPPQAQPHQPLPPISTIGDESVVIGDVRRNIGNRSVVIGATDERGNAILNRSMAIGHGAHAGAGSIAIGSGANAGGGQPRKMTAFEKQQRQMALSNLLAFFNEFAKRPCFSGQFNWREMLKTGGREKIEETINAFSNEARLANGELIAEFRKYQDELPDIAALAKPLEIKDNRLHGPPHRRGRFNEFHQIFSTSADAHVLLLQKSDTIKKWTEEITNARKWMENIRNAVVAKRRVTDEADVYE